MSRARRLLDLLHLLRRHRYPVTAASLASELGISVRTLYRDIATLQSQGAAIEGEAGLGYVLKPGFTLPPLMFTPQEIEALVLGIRWVNRHGDEALGAAARDALAKISALIPDDLRLTLESTHLLIGPSAAQNTSPLLAPLRAAIRGETKLAIAYQDARSRRSQRIVWPFALGYFDQLHVLIAWCEKRAAIRHFRTDRISDLTALNIRYPRRRQQLLKQWRESEGIAESDILL
ncbi:helix-turn-helix transcriptional regulator [Entomohabitans teleogrylli]|uniref:helix-turn-helix transcriptional regulator n=1 Tax=Entomohabitans teleogrylli TaxID=1384589 RepID=UPI00073D505A|nr:YafY family protein [Entomohabitans teleogrylli]